MFECWFMKFISWFKLLYSFISGSGSFCEWVPLYFEGDKAPVIRAAHPLTALQSQGARKRRRAGLRDYAWSIGDRVDVGINDW